MSEEWLKNISVHYSVVQRLQPPFTIQLEKKITIDICYKFYRVGYFSRIAKYIYIFYLYMRLIEGNKRKKKQKKKKLRVYLGFLGHNALYEW